MAGLEAMSEQTKKRWEAFVKSFDGQNYLGFVVQRRVYYADTRNAWGWERFEEMSRAANQAYMKDGDVNAMGVKMANAAREYGIPWKDLPKAPARPRSATSSIRWGEPGSREYQAELYRLIGKQRMVIAAQLYNDGLKQEQIRVRLHTSRYIVQCLREHFMVVFPEASRCYGCKKHRTKGLKMVVQSDDRLLCWVCDRQKRGDYAEWNAILDRAAAMYSEGYSRQQIMEDLKLHGTALHRALHTRPILRHCANCFAERRAGVPIGRGRYVHPETGAERYMATCRSCLRENAEAGYDSFPDPDARST